MMKKSSEEKSLSQQLENIFQEKKSSIFLGIDPQTQHIPKIFSEKLGEKKTFSENESAEQYGEMWYEYFSFVIETLSPWVAGIKLQSAYFEVLGATGVTTMIRLAKKAKEKKLLVLFDGKRADIPSTSQAYAAAYLDNHQKNGWGKWIDGMTTHPFLGLDTLEPLLRACAQWNKFLFICLKNSNAGSVELQNVLVKNEPFYLFLAKKIAKMGEMWELSTDWNENLGVVVGGNFPQQAQEIRKILPKSHFLVPGFGAQGADWKNKKNFEWQQGGEKTFYRGAIFPLSRGLTYPWLYAKKENNDESWKEFEKEANKQEIAALLQKTAKKYREHLG